MANIVIIGAGVMGSALAVPASKTNTVSLIGSLLDDDIIVALQETGHHPTLNAALPPAISLHKSSDDNQHLFDQADVVVIGVSSPGVEWALAELQRYHCRPDILALVTKGLVSGDNNNTAPQTYAQHLSDQLTSPEGGIVGIGGPCIARELALGIPTRVTFASHDGAAANKLRELLQTDTYRVTTGQDFTGLEACAALKNFMCIGVSAMFSAYTVDDTYAKNPIAALFNQAVLEINQLSGWIVRSNTTPNNTPTETFNANAFDLAGMGDLHVTVGGGRNSLLGRHLGTGLSLNDVIKNKMVGVTVEGVDTGRVLAKGFHHACGTGELNAAELPLTSAILDTIENDAIFDFKFNQLPG